MDTLSLPVILGTARSGRESKRAAAFIVNQLREDERFTPQLVDVRDHAPSVTVPPWGEGGANEQPTQWQHIARDAHGFIIVTPEYNHGYPGELKLLLDALFEEYQNKPVGICGVSGGGFGGSRVVDHIKPVLIEFGMVPTQTSMHVSNVDEALTEDGADRAQMDLAKPLTKMCSELYERTNLLRSQ
jgi:NAD(P)H-dependent FMN reductase